jgi:hypothetical protein
MLKIQSEKEFRYALQYGAILKTHCRNCSMPFSSDIVHTPEGWALTQVDGFCEDCWEDIVTNLSGDDDE